MLLVEKELVFFGWGVRLWFCLEFGFFVLFCDFRLCLLGSYRVFLVRFLMICVMSGDICYYYFIFCRRLYRRYISLYVCEVF